MFMVLKVLLIEVNTVPGMTPSTVLIHQVSIIDKLLVLDMMDMKEKSDDDAVV
jgi:D-alanine-D-alanine ligase-like ATP-grasp enzyme